MKAVKCYVYINSSNTARNNRTMTLLDRLRHILSDLKEHSRV